MRRLRLLPVALVAALALTAGACGGGSSGGGTSSGGRASGGTLTLGATIAPNPWDLRGAGLNGAELQYYEAVYDSLIRLDPNANPTANLATRWEWDATNTVLTLSLRSGVTFTDGSPLDAAAVVTNLLHTKDGTGEAAAALRDVRKAEAVDAGTVRITLSEPDPSFLGNLGQSPGMIASPRAISDGSIKTKPVGSGPYTLSGPGTTVGSQYTFIRNPKYWNAKAFPFDKVVIKVLADQTARENALRSGQVDAAEVAPGRMESLRGAGFNASPVLTGDIEGLYLWDRGGTVCKPLGDVRVRQAINYAFDRATIAKQLGGGFSTPTEQLFHPDSSAYDKSLDKRYPYDPAKAKQLLAQAGYANGFSCDELDFSTLFPAAQAAITQYLSAVGITLTPKSIPVAQILTSLQSAEVPLSYFRLSARRPWDTVRSTIAKDAAWNPYHYSDPEVDRLIADTQRLTGGEQDKAFKSLNKYLVDQAWSATWSVPQTAYALKKSLSVTPEAFMSNPPLYRISPAG
ncbi:ABC transporter substrate-binding protein [Pseudofrankia sp. BMG5.36]|uniref:ABC transporter substrate-binding protein n=1 Tax=Pseudofrankia sp. BMG5.36 TaxID=1834512 RepID=UPI0008DAE981|nr:ABC transporter substrate-binding protein [Pseudofrankia sp. BMG5.36]OHV62873.1 peptide ABC transporter substrate-binding protein [Pseudofrankia sp. BMG5.36]